MEVLRLLDINVCHPYIRERRKILLLAECLKHREDLLKRFGDYVALCACPEREHVNVIGFKLFGTLARLPIEEVAVLTPDGSMHCIQLHYVVEELSRTFSFVRKHFVFEKGGVVEVPTEAVKVSRFLTRVSKLLTRPS